MAGNVAESGKLQKVNIGAPSQVELTSIKKFRESLPSQIKKLLQDRLQLYVNNFNKLAIRDTTGNSLDVSQTRLDVVGSTYRAGTLRIPILGDTLYRGRKISKAYLVATKSGRIYVEATQPSGKVLNFPLADFTIEGSHLPTTIDAVLTRPAVRTSEQGRELINEVLQGKRKAAYLHYGQEDKAVRVAKALRDVGLVVRRAGKDLSIRLPRGAKQKEKAQVRSHIYVELPDVVKQVKIAEGAVSATLTPRDPIARSEWSLGPGSLAGQIDALEESLRSRVGNAPYYQIPKSGFSPRYREALRRYMSDEEIKMVEELTKKATRDLDYSDINALKIMAAYGGYSGARQEVAAILASNYAFLKKEAANAPSVEAFLTGLYGEEAAKRLIKLAKSLTKAAAKFRWKNKVSWKEVALAIAAMSITETVGLTSIRRGAKGSSLVVDGNKFALYRNVASGNFYNTYSFDNLISKNAFFKEGSKEDLEAHIIMPGAVLYNNKWVAGFLVAQVTSEGTTLSLARVENNKVVIIKADISVEEANKAFRDEYGRDSIALKDGQVTLPVSFSTELVLFKKSNGARVGRYRIPYNAARNDGQGISYASIEAIRGVDDTSVYKKGKEPISERASYGLFQNADYTVGGKEPLPIFIEGLPPQQEVAPKPTPKPKSKPAPKPAPAPKAPEVVKPKKEQKKAPVGGLTPATTLATGASSETRADAGENIKAVVTPIYLFGVSTTSPTAQFAELQKQIKSGEVDIRFLPGIVANNNFIGIFPEGSTFKLAGKRRKLTQGNVPVLDFGVEGKRMSLYITDTNGNIVGIDKFLDETANRNARMMGLAVRGKNGELDIREDGPFLIVYDPSKKDNKFSVELNPEFTDDPVEYIRKVFDVPDDYTINYTPSTLSSFNSPIGQDVGNGPISHFVVKEKGKLIAYKLDGKGNYVVDNDVNLDSDTYAHLQDGVYISSYDRDDMNVSIYMYPFKSGVGTSFKNLPGYNPEDVLRQVFGINAPTVTKVK